MSDTAGEPSNGAPRAEASDAPLLSLFLLGAGSWFGAFGMQAVLFSTLLVVELGETPTRVGAAQSALMLPSVVLVLIGGAFADRADRRRLLIALHAVAGVLVAGLACAVAMDRLVYAVMVGYALAMGTLQAFILPARDSMLSEVAGADLSRSVASLTLTQWGGQAFGALAASATRWFGPAPMLMVQSLLLFTGAPLVRRLPVSIGRASTAHFIHTAQTAGTGNTGPTCRTHPTGRTSASAGSMFSGMSEVLRSPVLLPTLVLVMAVGIVFVGPFQVVLPLMMRDTYAGGVSEIALVNTVFPFGTITGAVGIMLLGGLKKKGRDLLLALCGGAAILLVIGTGLPLWGTILGIWAWGACGSVFMIGSRTLFQQRAPAESRGRVLATYSFGFMGAAGVVGAPLSGALVARFGPEQTLGILGLAMFAVVAVVASLSRVRHVT